MWKPMLAGTVALALSGSSLALAQQRTAPATPQATPSAPAQSAPAAPAAPKASPQATDPSNAPTAGDRAAAERREQAENQAELEGRIAALKVRLMLTDEQAKNWPAFEKAYRDFATLRMQQWREFRDRKRSDNPLENMEARADFAIRRGTAMKEFAVAATPLYDSLDQDQQRQLRRAAMRGLRMMMHRGYGAGWGGRGDGDGGYGPGRGGRGDRDGGYGPRWGGRGDGDGGYGPRWGGRGDDDSGCDGGRRGWHHRGEGMMGPRGDGMMGPRRDGMMGPRRDGMMGPRHDGMMGPRGDGMTGPRWSWRDRGSDDQSGGSADDGSNGDDDNDNGGDRSGSQRLSPDEERF